MKEVASVCTEVCGMWAAELKKAIDFHNANSRTEEHPTHVFISGGSALLRGLDRVLGDAIGLPVKLFNPLQDYPVDKGIEAEYVSTVAPQMAIATGLALRTIVK